MIQNTSFASVVQHEIEHAILNGEYEPDSKLNEATLDEKKGVSRCQVRETFHTLEEAGRVYDEKNCGDFLPRIPIEAALGFFELQAAMEDLVGRLLAKNIAPPQLKELKSLVSATQQAVKDEDAHHYHLLDLQLHDRLVEMAGSRKLIKELPLYRRLNLAGGWLMPLSANEHGLIVKVIASGDEETPGRIMFTHAIESNERTRQSTLRRRTGCTGKRGCQVQHSRRSLGRTEGAASLSRRHQRAASTTDREQPVSGAGS